MVVIGFVLRMIAISMQIGCMHFKDMYTSFPIGERNQRIKLQLLSQEPGKQTLISILILVDGYSRLQMIYLIITTYSTSGEKTHEPSQEVTFKAPDVTVFGKNVQMKFHIKESGKEEWFDGVITGYSGITGEYSVFFHVMIRQLMLILMTQT